MKSRSSSLDKGNKDYAQFLEKEERELEFDHDADSLSVNIGFLIKRSAEILMDESPYPTSVFESIDNLRKTLSTIQKKKNSRYYKRSFYLAKVDIFDKEITSLLSEKELSFRHSLFETLVTTGSIDLEVIQNTLLDRYFFQFENYWETAISNLKRKYAIVNRRHYLVDQIQTFKSLLSSKGIHKYDQILDEYSSFNLKELEKLTS